MKFKNILLTTVASLSLAACITTTASQYTTSTNNVLLIQSVMSDVSSKLSVQDITVADGLDVTPRCRLVGGLDIGATQTVPAYMTEAFRAEFFTSGSYDVNAETILQVKLTSFNFNSFDGRWELGIDVSSPFSGGYHVDYIHNFSSSYFAGNACQNGADAFGPAVAKLIEQVVINPEFKKLFPAKAPKATPAE